MIIPKSDMNNHIFKMKLRLPILSLCNVSLISDIHKNLAHVIMLDEAGINHDVYFSRIVG
jgi:hypothetical protein